VIKYDEDYQPGRMEAASPDLACFVSEYSWRTNLDRGVKELVRKRDGFVIERKRLTPAEVEKLRAKQGEKLMQEISQQQQTSAPPAAINPEWEVINEITVKGYSGNKRGGNKLVVAVCPRCNRDVEALRYMIQAGKWTNCGYSCPARKSNLENSPERATRPRSHKVEKPKRQARRTKSIKRPARNSRLAKRRDNIPENIPSNPQMPPPQQLQKVDHPVPVEVERIVQEVVAGVNGHRDLYPPAKRIETCIGLAVEVPMVDAEAILRELERVEGSPFSSAAPQFVREVKLFLEFRRGLEAL
jgi:hypothetical protein